MPVSTTHASWVLPRAGWRYPLLSMTVNDCTAALSDAGPGAALGGCPHNDDTNEAGTTSITFLISFRFVPDLLKEREPPRLILALRVQPNFRAAQRRSSACQLIRLCSYRFAPLANVPCPPCRQKPEAILIQRPAVVGVVHVVIIGRRELDQQHGSVDEAPHSPRLSRDLLGVERMAFHRKALSGFTSFPAEVGRLRKSAHLAGSDGNLRAPAESSGLKKSANERYTRSSNSLMWIRCLRANGSISRALQRVFS
jgi:hypothetical protein